MACWWLTSRWPFGSDTLHMSATNGIISGRNLLAHWLVVVPVSITSMVLSWSSFVYWWLNKSPTRHKQRQLTLDRTDLYYHSALRTAVTSSLIKKSSSCCANGHVDTSFAEFLEPIKVTRLHQSFLGSFFSSSSCSDQKALLLVGAVPFPFMLKPG